jgi:putative FmdB family regulatory protein
MPIYEYSCQKCGAHIEAMQKISDKPLKRHAKCGGKLEKEWSRTGFQFKGSGWYVTDYAGKKSESKDNKDSKSETPETKTKATDSSESKTTKTDVKDSKPSSSAKTSNSEKK